TFLPRQLARNPLRCPGARGNFAIERDGALQGHKRAACGRVFDEHFVEFPGLRFTDADRDSNTSRLKPGEPAAVHPRIGGAPARHHSAAPRLDDGVSTRRSFARMPTRLQVNIQHRPTRLRASLLQRMYFRMRAPKALVIPPPHDSTGFD